MCYNNFVCDIACPSGRLEGRRSSVASTRTFPGGIHPKEVGNGKAATAAAPIRKAQDPVRVNIPMAQHIGAPAKALVSEGEYVTMGQLIGEACGPVSAPVHASVSGKVVSVGQMPTASGVNVTTVSIDNDFQDRWHESVQPRSNVEALSSGEIVQIIRDSGIVGLGGATFPTSVKVNVPKDQAVDTVILNGAECEPYLTADHVLMLEASKAIADGLLLVAKAVGAARTMVGIEANKPDAVEAMRKALADKPTEVVSLPVRYPQGGEKQLIYALTGRVVREKKLPIHEGVLVLNVATAAAISAAVRQGRPLIDRVVTVAGRVASPANLRVRIGTEIQDIIDQCGGFTEGVSKVLMGGPMMGQALPRLDLPVTKGVSGILAFGKEATCFEERACIRCARCVKVCPMNLMPTKIDALARRKRWEEADAIRAMSCIECGACTYVCPAKRQITLNCRVAKAGIRSLPPKPDLAGGK